MVSCKEMWLINNLVIDIELTWLVDGQSIYFIFDCFGCLQIYKMFVIGGVFEWISFQGQNNVEVLVSYDGKQIVMVQGNGNVYCIVVMDNSLGGQVWFLFLGFIDELFSFVLNVSMFLYVVIEGCCGVFYVVLVDGLVCQCFVFFDGDVCELSWGLYWQC